MFLAQYIFMPALLVCARRWGVDSPLGFPLACLALGLGEVPQVALHVQALCLMGLVLPIGEQVGVDQGVVPHVFGMPPHWLGGGHWLDVPACCSAALSLKVTA